MAALRKARIRIISLVLLMMATSVATAAAPDGQLRLSPAEVATLPKDGAGAGASGADGVQTSILFGDPTAAGPYTIAIRVPAHTVIAAHSHRDSRSAVVVSGTWWFGYGAVNTSEKLKALGPGSFYTEPGGQAHFARTGDQPVIVYITGIGPTDTHYFKSLGEPQRP